jgi:hypothetical protein
MRINIFSIFLFLNLKASEDMAQSGAKFDLTGIISILSYPP